MKALVLGIVSTVALTGCDFTVYDLPLPGGTDVGADPIEVTVQFTDVLDLVPQSTVKVNDVNVGMVRDVRLDGYTAEVVLELQEGTELPADAEARIRQTSLLGEKFVELAPPEEGASTEPLESGAVIPLERTGRNPEIEEVFGALSLVLNGGGIAQLRTINAEVADALEGREGSVRSVLQQLDSFTGQLDDRRTEIVNAIESIDALARGVQEEQGTIDAALDELPSAIKSIDSQREDLVKMLQALNRLGDVGVRVIRKTKADTISSLELLDPVLTQLANAGDNFVKAFQVFLTYPFVDEVVGRDPQVARNLHMGDYTNLAIDMDLDLAEILKNPPGLPNECVRLEQIPDELPLDQILELQNLCERAIAAIQRCLQEQDLQACGGLPGAVIEAVCDSINLPLPILCGGGGNGGGGGGGGLPLPELPGLPGGLGGLGGLLGLPRAPFTAGAGGEAVADTAPARPNGLAAYDPDLVRLLVPGMVTR
ncbi:MCE family protein [Nocardioides sp. SOB77]|uniref:MCE family protein n=1 Tax=Nocardioides oceani TaxID=3058369 RepID=A0ABT8FAD8_9ACTN|nr:MCE family protein [Nocardioides oceani]MDN4171649.1 MCE family protein [Nocardioides oceani]